MEVTTGWNSSSFVEFSISYLAAEAQPRDGLAKRIITSRIFPVF